MLFILLLKEMQMYNMPVRFINNRIIRYTIYAVVKQYS